MVKYDGTVRDSSNNIIQFLYGEDGMNAEFIEKQRIDLINLDDRQLSHQCKIFQIPVNKHTIFDEIKSYKGRFKDEVIDRFLNNADFVLQICEHYEELEKGRAFLRKLVKSKQKLHY